MREMHILARHCLLFSKASPAFSYPRSLAVVMQRFLEQFLVPDASDLVSQLQQRTGEGFRRLNGVVAQMLNDWSMISFTPLDYSDEDSLSFVLAQVSITRPSLIHSVYQHVHAFFMHAVAEVFLEAALTERRQGQT